MGTLYLVATPIGNLQGISIRAVRTLQEVNYVAYEDTRKTGILLKWLDDNFQNEVQPRPGPTSQGKPQLLSYYEQDELQRIPQILNLLKEGKNVALVTDAGTPTISDPGFKLVREVLRQGSQVVSIPGPSAVLTALASSGLPTDKFLFLGYLPKKPGHRKKLLRDLTLIQHSIKVTMIFFEAPHRLLRTLKELADIFGRDQEFVICRELTKVHEEIRREKVSWSIEHFQKVKPKGEITLLFHC